MRVTIAVAPEGSPSKFHSKQKTLKEALTKLHIIHLINNRNPEREIILYYLIINKICNI